MEYDKIVPEIENRDGATSIEQEVVTKLNDVKSEIRGIEVSIYQYLDEVADFTATEWRDLIERVEKKHSRDTLDGPAFEPIIHQYTEILKNNLTSIYATARTSVDGLLDKLKATIDVIFEDLDKVPPKVTLDSVKKK
jgi:hypothetical protein